MPYKTDRAGERGAALLAALMMLVVVSVLAVFIASATTATANDIQQHTSTQDEYWVAKSMAETVEGSVRTDIPTAYDLEMRLARAATIGTPLPVFDAPSLAVEASNPVYSPTAWTVDFNLDGTISVNGTRLRAAPGATSLFGNLALWLNTHKGVPITYAANRGYNPVKLNLNLNEAYRLTPSGGTSEPQYVVQFGIDAQSGAGGRVRQTGLLTLGPPLATTGDLCAGLAASLNVTVVNNGLGLMSRYSVNVTYTNASHLTVTEDTSGAISTLYDQDVTDEPIQRTINLFAAIPASRTVFTLNAQRRAPDGSVCTLTRQVIVRDCSESIVSFTASPTSISPGQSSTLRWNVDGADQVTITGPGVNYTGGTSGTLAVSPAVTSTYNLTATSGSGNNPECPNPTGSVTVTVCTDTPQVNSFQAQPNVIAAGQSSTLSWNIRNADSVAITPDVGDVSPVGSISISPQQTTTYTITATNTCGSVSSSVTVTVCTGPPTINSFMVDPPLIAPGEEATISWNVSAADLVQINPMVGTVTPVGQVRVSPPQTTSYTLVAQNACGQRTLTITLSVSDGGDDDGGGSGGETKKWCDQTIIGLNRQYTRFAVTLAPGGGAGVAGIVVVSTTDPVATFPCSPIVSYQPFNPANPATVWLTVNDLGLRPYPASTCCFGYGPGAEWSILVTVNRLFLATDRFGDTMSVQGVAHLMGNNGCAFDYNYSVSPYARGNCPPRGIFGLAEPGQANKDALIADCLSCSGRSAPGASFLDMLIEPNRRRFPLWPSK